LIVPVNTLTNWENEFEIWTGNLSYTVPVTNLSGSNSGSRGHLIEKWAKKGGVLLASDSLFQSIIKKKIHEKYLQCPGPDVIVLDEAHTMLKNSSNVIFKALMGVNTRRRICLTGSPFQNNLFEYFRMISYVRPGVLGTSERAFEREYVDPILAGEPSDAPEDALQLADEKLNKLQETLEPYVHRKDATVLLKDLPPMQQVVLQIRRTKVQSRLYNAFKKHRATSEGAESNNFLKDFHALRPIHNHPGCLLRSKTVKDMELTSTKPTVAVSNNGDSNTGASKTVTEASRLETAPGKKDTQPLKPAKHETDTSSTKQSISSGDKKKESGVTTSGNGIIDLISDSEDEDPDAMEEETISNEEWWRKVARRDDVELSDITSGNKVVLLLHILMHASILDERVVVFSQCLKVRVVYCSPVRVGLFLDGRTHCVPSRR
jgi:SNF2 family DNA or RNA helicase